MSRQRAGKRTVEIKLNLEPAEFARLEELASFEGESLEGTIRLVLQYHWNSYERFKAECGEAEQQRLAQGAAQPAPGSTDPDDNIPW